MSTMNFLAAIASTVRDEMRRDPRVFAMGEDMQSGLYGDFGLAEFGPERVRNTPISEAGFIGAAMGAALTGMRPFVDASASTFLYPAMDQIVNQIAKSRYMFGGQGSIPLVIRSTVLYGKAAAAHHSDRPWGMFAQVPGLKIVVPTTPADAKGLLTASIRDDNPVLWMEDAVFWGRRDEVPDGEHVVPLGVANVRREGVDVTIVGIAGAVSLALDAAAILETEGISAEVIDPRTIVPFDWETVLASVDKTRRLVVVDPAPGTCSVASEIAATVGERAFGTLLAPVVRLTAPDIPVPFSPELEKLVYPTVDDIVAAARRVLAPNAGERSPARV